MDIRPSCVTRGKTYEREGLVMTRIVCTIGPSTEEKTMMQR